MWLTKGRHFEVPANFADVTFNYPVSFCESVFYDLADFGGSTFNDSADFTATSFNDTAGVQGPDKFKSIITDDEKTCSLFRIYYKNRGQLLDAYNIYYDYRNQLLAVKSWNDLSKWFDILCLVTCGYGLKPDYSLGLGIWIIGVFAFIYKTGPKITCRNNEKLISGVFDANIVFDGNLVRRNSRPIPNIPRFDWQGPIIYRLQDATKENSTVTWWDALYFSIIRFTNVGSAEWNTKDRIWATIEGLAGWIMLGIFMATLANVMMNINF